MQKWEYCFLDGDGKDWHLYINDKVQKFPGRNYEKSNWIKLLNDLGESGWEAVSHDTSSSAVLWCGKHSLDTKKGHCKVDSFFKVEFSTI